jgi:hypothetical protein
MTDEQDPPEDDSSKNNFIPETTNESKEPGLLVNPIHVDASGKLWHHINGAWVDDEGKIRTYSGGHGVQIGRYDPLTCDPFISNYFFLKYDHLEKANLNRERLHILLDDWLTAIETGTPQPGLSQWNS